MRWPVFTCILACSCIIALVLFSSCKDAAHECKVDDDCGFSCTYGCVASAWYADRNETRECSSAPACTCVKGACSPPKPI